jgi:hypothetical protein
MSASATGAAPSTSAGEGVNTGATTPGQATQPAPTGEQQTTTEKMFTQADVDAVVKARLAEERRKAEKARADAELPELAKRDARIAELEEGLTAAQRKERDYALRDGIAEIVARDDFPATPVASGARLLKLLDPDAIQWGEDGTPKNLPALLAGLVRSDPYLFRAKERRPGPGDAGHFGTIPNAADMNAQIRQKAGRG